MAPWRDSPTLSEWWKFDGVPYRLIAEQIGVGHSRVAGLAKDRGFQRGQGKRSSQWTYGPCLGDECKGKFEPVPVKKLTADRLCGTCATRQDDQNLVVDLAAERRAWMERKS